MDLTDSSTFTATADATPFDPFLPSQQSCEDFGVRKQTSVGSEVASDLKPKSANLNNMGIPNNWSDGDSFSNSHHAVLDYLPSLPAPPGFDELALLESQEESAHYPSPSHSSLYISEPVAEMEKDVTDPKSVAGVCGLHNLGNTCFMNAGLQCLLNNSNFVHFFLEHYKSDEYTKDLLAGKFAELAAKVWSGQYSVLHLSDFKEALGKYHPQFKDFRQHDCQEFLALLLDSMHEQLNTAKYGSSHPARPLDKYNCCATYLEDKTVEVETDKNTSDAMEDDDVKDVADVEMVGYDCQVEHHPHHEVYPQSHGVSDNSSHSASPYSTDSLNSWDINSGFRLYPVPEDVKPFDVPSVSTKDMECKVSPCVCKNIELQKIPLENNAIDNCRAENIIPLESLKKGTPINRIKCSQYLCPISLTSKKIREKNEFANQFNPKYKVPSIEDFVKETKTLNTNILVSEITNNQLKFDSDKFPKHENMRLRDTVDNLSELKELETKHLALKRVKETNIIHEQQELIKDLSDDMLQEICGTSKRMKIEEKWSVIKPANDTDSDVDIMESEKIPADISESSQSDEMNDIISRNQKLLSGEENSEADSEWEKYQAKNQSIVVDSYQGQFQSKVVCSECGNISVTYEPFMYLPVPIPHALERQIAISYIPTERKRPARYLATVHNYDKVYKLKEALVALIGENCPREIIFAEVFDNHISRLLDDNVLVKYINDTTRTVYAFALSPPPISCSNTEESSISDKGEYQELENDPGGGNEARLSKKCDDSVTSHVTDMFGDQQMEDPSIHIRKEQCSKTSCNSQTLETISCKENDNWFSTNHMENDGVSSSSNCDKVNEQEMSACQTGLRFSCWRSCAICLEDMPDTNLLIHPPCQCVLCHSCIEISCKHYGGNSLICPVCSIPIKPEEEFVPVNKIDDYKVKISLVSVPIVFRLDTLDGNSLKNKMLLGHPGLLKLPTSLPATLLYECVDKSVPFLSTYTLLFVDGQGRNCSRCLYTEHCSGCEVARVGDISFLPGDSLAVRFTYTSVENMEIAASISDHHSMEQKRHQVILTLYDCLEAFSKSETLDELNPWYCPVCMQNQRARKSLSVWRCPDTLIIYLKRFVFHEYSTTKIDDKVSFPLEGLDLTSYISGPCSGSLVYNLQAYVCHFGGVNSGHYTAYAKHAITDEWYYFNDEIVTKQVSKEEDYSQAYILFYQKFGNEGLLPFCKKGALLCNKPIVSPDEGSSCSVSLKHQTISHILQHLENHEEHADGEDKRNEDNK